VGGGSELEHLLAESGELAAIFTTSHKTAMENLRKAKRLPFVLCT
jgi:hypothetical protein